MNSQNKSSSFTSRPASSWIRLAASLGRGANALLDTLFPEPCAGCGAAPQTAGALFCAECFASVHDAAVGSDADAPDEGQDEGTRSLVSVPTLAPFHYSPLIRNVVHALKFQGESQIAKRMAREMAPLLAQVPGYERLCLVPVPVHLMRIVERGYNQSALLAHGIAACYRLGAGRGESRAAPSVAARCLERVALSAHQASLGRAERLQLTSAAFRVRVPPTLPVVLVDDVLTTGSTAQACVSALQRQGVEVAAVLTFARA